MERTKNFFSSRLESVSGGLEGLFFSCGRMMRASINGVRYFASASEKPWFVCLF